MKHVDSKIAIIDELWKDCGKTVERLVERLWKDGGKPRKAVEKLRKSCGKAAEKLWKSCGKAVEKLWESCGKAGMHEFQLTAGESFP